MNQKDTIKLNLLNVIPNAITLFNLVKQKMENNINERKIIEINS